MHSQLELLLQIQDLKNQQRELADGQDHAQVEAEHFNVDIDGAIEQLDQRIADLVGELEPAVRAHYERIARSHKRVVVPVINAMCYGCFVSVAAAQWPDIARNDELHHCAHCGRFLYALD